MDVLETVGLMTNLLFCIASADDEKTWNSDQRSKLCCFLVFKADSSRSKK